MSMVKVTNGEIVELLSVSDGRFRVRTPLQDIKVVGEIQSITNTELKCLLKELTKDSLISFREYKSLRQQLIGGNR